MRSTKKLVPAATPQEVAEAMSFISYVRGRHDLAETLLETTEKFGVALPLTVKKVLESEVAEKPELTDAAVEAAVRKARGQ